MSRLWKASGGLRGKRIDSHGTDSANEKVKEEMTTIKKAWEEFEKVIFQGMKVVSKVQRDETKKAFYAGFINCLKEINELGLADKPKEDKFQSLHNWIDESLEWQKTLQREVDARDEAKRKRGNC